MKTIKNKRIIMIALFTFFISGSVFANSLFASENGDKLPTGDKNQAAENAPTKEEPVEQADVEITIFENEDGTIDINAIANGEDVSEHYQSIINEEENGDQKTYSVELEDVEFGIIEDGDEESLK